MESGEEERREAVWGVGELGWICREWELGNWSGERERVGLCGEVGNRSGDRGAEWGGRK